MSKIDYNNKNLSKLIIFFKSIFLFIIKRLKQLKYYYNLGITNPNNISNILYNQVNFADACNFNNVYITIVPKTISNNKNPIIGLSPIQKEAIIDSLRSAKVITTETIILDPVYIAIDLCVPADSSALSITESLNSSLYIVKDSNSRKDNNTIINDVNEVFLEYFDRSNSVLGQTLDINELTNKILSVDGVKTFYTKNNISGDIYNGLSFIAWNPIYKEDIQLVNKNMNFAYFKYIYLNNKTEIKNRIQIIYQESSIDNIEY